MKRGYRKHRFSGIQRGIAFFFGLTSSKGKGQLEGGSVCVWPAGAMTHFVTSSLLKKS